MDDDFLARDRSVEMEDFLVSSGVGAEVLVLVLVLVLDEDGVAAAVDLDLDLDCAGVVVGMGDADLAGVVDMVPGGTVADRTVREIGGEGTLGTG